MFSGCQSHQNIDILVPKNTNKAAQQLSWCQEGVPSGAKPAAKQPSWCQDAKISAKLVPRCQDIKISFAREAIWSHWSRFPGLPGGPKIDHFGTQIPKWLAITKTYYLLYKSYVFWVPKPLKYRYFGTQKHHQSS